jgi:hypothetical protein
MGASGSLVAMLSSCAPAQHRSWQVHILVCSLSIEHVDRETSFARHSTNLEVMSPILQPQEAVFRRRPGTAVDYRSFHELYAFPHSTLLRTLDTMRTALRARALYLHTDSVLRSQKCARWLEKTAKPRSYHGEVHAMSAHGLLPGQLICLKWH